MQLKVENHPRQQDLLFMKGRVLVRPKEPSKTKGPEIEGLAGKDNKGENGKGGSLVNTPEWYGLNNKDLERLPEQVLDWECEDTVKSSHPQGPWRRDTLTH